MTKAFVEMIEGPVGQLEVSDTGPVDGDKGPPILLIHGINMTKEVWRDMTPQLGADRRIISFDLRGHGNSVKKGPYTAQDYAADALAVLDVKSVEAAHVLGVSYGGSVACVLAATFPKRVKSIGCFGSAIEIQGVDANQIIGFLNTVGVKEFFKASLAQAAFAPGADENLLDLALDMAIKGRDEATVAAVIETALAAGVSDIIEKVTCPALVVTGELDATCPVPIGQALAEALGSQHLVIGSHGHMLPLEAPKELTNLIIKHLQNL